MTMNEIYRGPGELPRIVPVFPLTGVLLLPRGQLPLNIFEKRYLSMVDDAMKGDRIIGMIQPNPELHRTGAIPALFSVGCAGRITQISETGDGRYHLTLTGVARFKIIKEAEVATAYRQCEVDFGSFLGDFDGRLGENQVDREGVIRTLREFAETNNLQIDWKSINEVPNEALVNALSMMSPFGPKEKQALLEASDLKGRAEVLVAITEFELARGKTENMRLQ
jgi:Lon protease-like protein